MRVSRKFFSLLMAVLMTGLLTCPALASSFPDVADDAPYAEAAEYLNEIGIMQGDTSGKFNPDRNVTRAQMAAILCRMLGETENLTKDGTKFTDVPTSYWAYGEIAKAAELGIINGYNDGTFKPNNTVTYEQALKMLVAASGQTEAAEALGGYPNGYVSLANELGYTNNISANCGSPLNRSTVAVMLVNYLFT